MGERRSDEILLKLDTPAFRSAMYALKREDPEPVLVLREERRKLRQHSYEAVHADAVKAKKRRYWYKLATAEYLATKARKERERYEAKKKKR